MRSQAQYTIYGLNDIYTAATAPTNPYNGQLWVDTSQNPPITKVYNGTSWKEQNGTDTIKSNVQTLTTKQATFETNLSGLTSIVSTHTTQITNIGDVVDGNCDDIKHFRNHSKLRCHILEGHMEIFVFRIFFIKEFRCPLRQIGCIRAGSGHNLNGFISFLCVV